MGCDTKIVAIRCGLRDERRGEVSSIQEKVRKERDERCFLDFDIWTFPARLVDRRLPDVRDQFFDRDQPHRHRAAKINWRGIR